MIDWVLEVFCKYATFDGRARRKEYWYWYLFNLIVGVVICAVMMMSPAIETQTDNGLGWFGVFIRILGLIYSLGVVIPNLAVTVRRLHDTNRSGWSYFISLVPIIGGILLFIFLVEDSTPGDNQYGPNPKAELETTA